MAAVPSTPDHAGDPTADVEAVGRRVEALLETIAEAEPTARLAAEDLVRELVGLYGAALERLVGRLAAASPDAVRALADDDLVAGLLVLHDLHPASTRERLEEALALFPGVTLAGVSEDTARVQVSGGCGCGSSELPPGAEAAIRAAAPEIDRVEVVAPPPTGLIPASALTSRPATAAP